MNEKVTILAVFSNPNLRVETLEGTIYATDDRFGICVPISDVNAINWLVECADRPEEIFESIDNIIDRNACKMPFSKVLSIAVNDVNMFADYVGVDYNVIKFTAAFADMLVSRMTQIF